MEENTKDIKDYIIAVKKRIAPVIIIALILVFISTTVAFLLPPVYKSSATILIESQEIPAELVMSTVTSYASERIQTIQARVMSRTNLLKIVEKFGLYTEKKKYVTSEEIVEFMHDDISLDMISANVVDPRSGRPSTATIAFSVSYKGVSPDSTQKVASELTSLYLNENLKNRAQKSEETADFFDQEIERLSKTIAEYESKIAIFKEENTGLLPEHQGLNISSKQRLESDLDSIDAKISSLEDRQFYLEGQLAQIEPGNPAVMGSSQRLAILESQYATATSRYSSEHPDVFKLKNEIESLKLEVKDDYAKNPKADELVRLRADLVQQDKKYTKDHPDIVRLKEKIASLELELEKQQDNAEDVYYQKSPENPAYITLSAQLDGIRNDIKSTASRKDKINVKLLEIEKKIYKSPEIEREYLNLKRDYENAIVNYRETKYKQQKANVAKQLEADSKGEKFTLIDPPALPEKPISPNRPAIIFLGIILSLGGGLGFAFVSDAISGAVRGAKSLQSTFGALPLSVIPYEMNLYDKAKRNELRSVLSFCLL